MLFLIFFDFSRFEISLLIILSVYFGRYTKFFLLILFLFFLSNQIINIVLLFFRISHCLLTVPLWVVLWLIWNFFLFFVFDLINSRRMLIFFIILNAISLFSLVLKLVLLKNSSLSIEPVYHKVDHFFRLFFEDIEKQWLENVVDFLI